MSDDAGLLETVCATAVEWGASDVILHEGRRPRIRVAGRLHEADLPAPGIAFFEDLWVRVGVPVGTRDADAAWVSATGQRFRLNLLNSLGRRGAVLRRIPGEIPALDSLGVPAEVLRGWASSRSGMILLSGPTGSGKSTTIAALLDDLNSREERHIVTIEDPVEYAFSDRHCLFTQREVGIDTPGFAEGLRRSLRQNPDVIFLGEIRDAETATTAFQAAETGHLLLATVHAATAPEVMERLEGLFETEAREGVRKTLSAQTLGILCQKLLPGTDGNLVLVCEYFSNRGMIRKLIAEGRRAELADAIAADQPPSAFGFLAALAELVRSGRLATDVALEVATNPQELQRALRGITSSSAGTRR